MSEDNQKAGVKEFTPPNLEKRNGMRPADNTVCNVRKYSVRLGTWLKYDKLSEAIKSRNQGECIIWDDKE